MRTTSSRARFSTSSKLFGPMRIATNRPVASKYPVIPSGDMEVHRVLPGPFRHLAIAVPAATSPFFAASMIA